MAMMAKANRTWINPFKVKPVASPMAHITSNTKAAVKSMVVSPLYQKFCPTRFRKAGLLSVDIGMPLVVVQPV
jgi:hypothetical protein